MDKAEATTSLSKPKYVIYVEVYVQYSRGNRGSLAQSEVFCEYRSREKALDAQKKLCAIPPLQLEREY
jgi:hypothetical protein